jgi:hypothetical protein
VTEPKTEEGEPPTSEEVPEAVPAPSDVPTREERPEYRAIAMRRRYTDGNGS